MVMRMTRMTRMPTFEDNKSDGGWRGVWGSTLVAPRVRNPRSVYVITMVIMTMVKLETVMMMTMIITIIVSEANANLCTVSRLQDRIILSIGSYRIGSYHISYHIIHRIILYIGSYHISYHIIYRFISYIGSYRISKCKPMDCQTTPRVVLAELAWHSPPPVLAEWLQQDALSL